MQVPGMTVMMSPVSTRNVAPMDKAKACILLSVPYVYHGHRE